MIKVETRKEGPMFAVRVSPGAARTRVLGDHDGALKLAVNAPPEKGKANKAVVEFLAGALGVPKNAITVISGEASRSKKIAVEGVAADVLRQRLEGLIGTTN